MEWNGMRLLGLSASLLAGRTGKLPPLFPGPGQPTDPVKQSLNLLAIQRRYLPFTGGSANASIGCNARCLILDFKIVFQMNDILFPDKLENQTIKKNGKKTKSRSENQKYPP